MGLRNRTSFGFCGAANEVVRPVSGEVQVWAVVGSLVPGRCTRRLAGRKEGAVLASKVTPLNGLMVGGVAPHPNVGGSNPPHKVPIKDC